MEVFIIASLTADGFIARGPEHRSLDWTSPEDKKMFVQTTKQAGVVVMGRRTFGTIKFPLKDRLTVVYTHQTKQDLGAKYEIPLEEMTAENLKLTDQDPAALIKDLKTAGYDQLAVCGGSSIYRQFWEAGVVDKLLLTIEPVLFGQGVSLFNQPLEQRLKLTNSKQLNQQGTLLLTYES